MDIPTNRYKEYEEKYFNSMYAFEIAKDEFEKKYIPSQYCNPNYIWNLIYKDNIVKITRI